MATQKEMVIDAERKKLLICYAGYHFGMNLETIHHFDLWQALNYDVEHAERDEPDHIEWLKNHCVLLQKDKKPEEEK